MPESLAQRLVTQQRYKEATAQELADLTETLQGLQKEMQEATEKQQALDEQQAAVSDRRRQQEERLAANVADAKKLTEDGEASREELSAMLKDRLQDVNDRIATLSTREETLRVEREQLLGRIDVLETHQRKGMTSFDDVFTARDKEMGSLSAQAQSEESLSELLQKKLDVRTAQAALLREEHAGLKEKVDVYAERFKRIQQRVRETRNTFEARQRTNVNRRRQLATAQTALQKAQSQLNQTRQAHASETEHEARLQKQLTSLEETTEKLRALAVTLKATASGGTV